VQIKNIIRHK